MFLFSTYNYNNLFSRRTYSFFRDQEKKVLYHILNTEIITFIFILDFSSFVGFSVVAIFDYAPSNHKWKSNQSGSSLCLKSDDQ